MGKITPKFHGKIVDGKIVFNNEIKFYQYLRDLKGDVYVEVGKEKKTRSNSQNNYYWAYLTIISEETGDDPNSLHEVFKRKFIPPVFVKVLGKDYKLPASTTELSKLEFGEYITRIENLTNIPAPNPEEFLYV